SCIDLARQCSVEMKTYMDMKNNYDDSLVHERSDKQIEDLNNKRIDYMIQALEFAVWFKKSGQGADEFVRKNVEVLNTSIDDEASETEQYERTLDRWDNVGTKDSWEQIKQQFNDRNGGD
ncbi:hypothetical protein, partial [Salmonella enterica]|uniref:hypothetical protein n=1 Tax=Salmonella enterica TaxID=28901 RepID=UPI001C300CE5